MRRSRRSSEIGNISIRAEMYYDVYDHTRPCSKPKPALKSWTQVETDVIKHRPKEVTADVAEAHVACRDRQGRTPDVGHGFEVRIACADVQRHGTGRCDDKAGCDMP